MTPAQSGRLSASSPGPTTASGTPAAAKATPTAIPGVPVRLSEGAEQPEASAGATVAPAQPLPDAAVAQVISRLPAMPAATGEAVEFAMRPASQPAPRPGQTIQEPFPPPAPAVSPVGAPESGPLEVLRLPAGGGRPARAVSQRDVQPADGRADEPARPGEGSRAGQALAAAGRQVALGRHEDADVRADRPLPDGDQIHGGNPGGHQIGHGRDARQGRDLDLHHAAAHPPGVLSDDRPGPPRRDDVRRLRPEDRPRCRPGDDQGRDERPAGGRAPRHRRRGQGRPGREPDGSGQRRTAAGWLSRRPSRCHTTPM